MGWPRKNEVARIYRDKDKKSFFIIFLDERYRYPNNGNYEALANVYDGPNPSLCNTGVSLSYICNNWLKRMQWDELPKNWRGAFRHYIGDPRKIRGFWRVA